MEKRPERHCRGATYLCAMITCCFSARLKKRHRQPASHCAQNRSTARKTVPNNRKGSSVFLFRVRPALSERAKLSKSPGVFSPAEWAPRFNAFQIDDADDFGGAIVFGGLRYARAPGHAPFFWPAEATDTRAPSASLDKRSPRNMHVGRPGQCPETGEKKQAATS